MDSENKNFKYTAKSDDESEYLHWHEGYLTIMSPKSDVL
jgi:hypothetical protein